MLFRRQPESVQSAQHSVTVQDRSRLLPNLIFIYVVKYAVLWNDLNQRKSFAVYDTAGILTSVDKWLDDYFVFFFK